MSVIAVFSGAYCSAEEIVEQVADRLGYKVVGRELLEEAARDFDASAVKLARAMTGTRGFLNTLTHEWEKSLIYIRAALAKLLKTDDQVYHGPAMHLIPQEISHVLRVGLIADHDFRVAQAAAQEGVDPGEAAARVQRNDEELAKWTRQVRSAGPWEPQLYDIVIPLPERSVEEAVELICENVAKEALKPNDRSIQAVLDFQLATGLNMKLLERGRYNCEIKAKAGRVTVTIHQSRSQGQLARTVKALRYESLEDEVRQLCTETEGVVSVEVRPGVGYAKPPRTLLVDDEQEYVMTLSERLEVRDIPADVAYDGQQALTYVNTDVPDVMVLDLRMPGMDGMEVLRRIKQQHPEVEVIIVTGHGSDKDERLARDLGAFDFLKKPVDINVLAEKIKAASERAGQRGGGDDEDAG